MIDASPATGVFPRSQTAIAAVLVSRIFNHPLLSRRGPSNVTLRRRDDGIKPGRVTGEGGGLSQRLRSSCYI